MATKDSGLSAEERQAVKDRAKELRAQEKAGKNRAAGEKAVREAIDALTDLDLEIAEGFYALVTKTAPDLVPKTYYGMPGFANADGKIVVFMQPAQKFGTRYSTIGFEGTANLDDGDVWATAHAVVKWTPAVEKLFAGLVAKAVS